MATPAPLPRQLYLWLSSLDLSYKVQNPREDLSNGYIVAQILARYYPGEIQMYSFDNGFKNSVKLHNWEFLSRFFKKFGIEIYHADYDPVAHRAPGAAIVLIKKLYSHLTGKEAPQPIKPASINVQEKEVPDYAKPTIANKMKDRELVRIVDMKKQANKAEEIIYAHNQTLRVERQNPARYTKKTTLIGRQFMQSTMSSQNSPQRKAISQTQQQQEKQPVKEVAVKVAGKKGKGKSAKGLFSTQEDASSSAEYLMGEVIQRIIFEKLNKADPEFKQYKTEIEQVSSHFKENFDKLPDQVLAFIFLKIETKSDDIATVIQNNPTQLLQFFNYCSYILKKLNPNSCYNPELQGDFNSSTSQHTATTSQQAPQKRPHFQSLAETIADVANKVLNHDPMICEMVFLEYVLPQLLQILKQSPLKLNLLSFLLYTFVSTNMNSHLRLLKKTKSLLLDEFGVFMQILANLVQLEKEETMNNKLFQFYLSNSQIAFERMQPITRVKGLAVVSFLSRVSATPLVPLLNKIQMLMKEYHWEIKGQILIICSNILMKLNQPSNTTDQNQTGISTDLIQNQQQQQQQQQQHPYIDEQEKKIAKEQLYTGGVVEEEPSTITNQSPSKDLTQQNAPAVTTQRDQQGNQINIPAEEEGKIDDDQTPSPSFIINSPTPIPQIPVNIEQVTTKVFTIIYQGFNENSPKMTQKLGLIYLAKLMHLYPQFAQTYIDILLKADICRNSVLQVNPLEGSEQGFYVSGCYTQKYRTYGAPLQWNSLYIAQELEKRIKFEKLKTFETAHLDIFEGTLVQDFIESEIALWMEIFESLKSYFFIALTDRDDSISALHILKRFFCNNKMTDHASRQIIVRTTKLMIKPQVDQECRDNFRNFLQFIHDYQIEDYQLDEQQQQGSETSQIDRKNKLKEFVYQVIKSFATQMPVAYEKSNLIDLMNRVVAERRGDIY